MFCSNETELKQKLQQQHYFLKKGYALHAFATAMSFIFLVCRIKEYIKYLNCYFS